MKKTRVALSNLFKSKVTQEIENLIKKSNDVTILEHNAQSAKLFDIELDRYLILNREPIFKGYIQFHSSDMEQAVIFACKMWADNHLPIFDDWSMDSLNISIDIMDNKVAFKKRNKEIMKNVYESTRQIIESRIKSLILIK